MRLNKVPRLQARCRADGYQSAGYERGGCGSQSSRPRCRKRNSSCLTVYKDSDAIFNALMAGANGYLLKQTPPQGLAGGAAGGMCRRLAPMTSQIARKIVEAFRQTRTHSRAKPKG